MHRTIAATWLIAALSLSVSACVGSLEFNGPPNGVDGADAGTASSGDARAMFLSDVEPIVQRCAGGSCHTGTATTAQFLGNDGQTDDYAAIISFPKVTGDFDPTVAGLLTKIDAGGHNGMSYTAAEHATIEKWLSAEHTARASGGGDTTDAGPGATGTALSVWSGCMTKANWDQAEMGTWADKQTQDGNTCTTCHNDGAYRFNTNADNDTMFTANRSQLDIIGFFTVLVETNGTETVVPAYDKLKRMGDGSTFHPRFGYDTNDPYVARLANFYQLTFDTQSAGQCGPPVF